ncbi:hypothetical protein HK103_001178 [Boothiomyces macroporosus]|uniref:N-acetyltransferase domain-containing protein n=1 Tax=Boothiomyces macroporosus TaxID=261099 RepID=A0AAD5UJR3_9FUNG|nr:hypothetical protein HK103_001178 [Boothiomyces macroporosus]
MAQVLKCTPETYADMTSFIARRNTIQHCLVLGESVPVVEADFKMMEYQPLENFYIAMKDGKLVGAIGLEHDKYILGPWTEECESLQGVGQILFDHAIQIAKEKKYPHVTLYVDGASQEVLDFFVENGAKVQGNEWGMELTKGEYPPIETNPDLSCATVDTPSDIGKQVLELHTELFGNSVYNQENWERRTRENHIVYGCFKDSKLLSYAIIQVQEQELYLSHIGTLKSARGQGSASKLLVHLQEYFLKSGYSKVFLNVQMKNEGAARLYERVGFKVSHKAVGLNVPLQ